MIKLFVGFICLMCGLYIGYRMGESDTKQKKE